MTRNRSSAVCVRAGGADRRRAARNRLRVARPGPARRDRGRGPSGCASASKKFSARRAREVREASTPTATRSARSSRRPASTTRRARSTPSTRCAGTGSCAGRSSPAGGCSAATHGATAAWTRLRTSGCSDDRLSQHPLADRGRPHLGARVAAHELGPTWAWAIVALTITVRMLLVPLTVWQIHSMQRMRSTCRR